MRVLKLVVSMAINYVQTLSHSLSLCECFSHTSSTVQMSNLYDIDVGIV